MAPDPQDRKAGARWAPAFRALGDERLTRLAQGGSDAAFAAIYGRYAPMLHGYCRSILHDEEEAGDALQNAMLKALTALRRSGPAGPLRPWLFRIAHNESITLLRQRSRRPGELPEERASAGDTTIRHAVAREDLATLLVDLDRLTEHQRGALVMRELGGLSYDDVATALETSPLAARQAVFAARRKLTAPAPSFGALLPAAPLSAGAVLALASGTGGAAAGGGAAASGVLSLFTGGGAKALAGVLATATVGVGSVELAHELPAPDRGERRAQVTTPDAGERPATAASRSAAGTGAAGHAAAVPVAATAGQDDAAPATSGTGATTGRRAVSRTRTTTGRAEADRPAGGDRRDGERTGGGGEGGGARGGGFGGRGGSGTGGRPGARPWTGRGDGSAGTTPGGSAGGGSTGGGSTGGGSTGGGSTGGGWRPGGGARWGGGTSAGGATTVPAAWSSTGRTATTQRADCPQPTATPASTPEPTPTETSTTPPAATPTAEPTSSPTVAD